MKVAPKGGAAKAAKVFHRHRLEADGEYGNKPAERVLDDLGVQ
ncbi:MAG TPA: hypothetical protein VFD70_00040 [Anaerolineae bacterium]|nr:hypothetical protein [Anaerolineae bacterium]